MDLVETTKQAQEIINNVKSYAAAINSEISDMQSKIDRAAQDLAGHTQRYIERYKQTLQERIARYTEYLNEQMASAQADAQKKLDEIAQDIKDQVISQSLKTADQLKKFA